MRASIKRVKRVFIFLLISTFLFACKPPEGASSAQTGSSGTTTGSIQARLELDGDPALGSMPLTVYLLEDGAGVSGATIEITGDMTHAGMVPVIVEATETETGLYRAEDFEFTMAGDWIITTDVELPDGSKERVESLVTVPGN